MAIRSHLHFTHEKFDAAVCSKFDGISHEVHQDLTQATWVTMN